MKDKTNTFLLVSIIILLVISGGIYYFGHKNTDTCGENGEVCSEAPGMKKVKPNSEIPAHLITADQITQMETLMKNNGKSLKGLHAYSFQKDDMGMIHIRFYVYLNGVRADESIYHFKSDGTISSITNEVNTDISPNISTTPKISESQAIVLAGSKIKNKPLVGNQEFWNKNVGKPGDKDLVLAWRVRSVQIPSLYVIIDAQTGEIIYFDDGVRY